MTIEMLGTIDSIANSDWSRCLAPEIARKQRPAVLRLDRFEPALQAAFADAA